MKLLYHTIPPSAIPLIITLYSIYCIDYSLINILLNIGYHKYTVTLNVIYKLFLMHGIEISIFLQLTLHYSQTHLLN
jgi:hypothetical protein